MISIRILITGEVQGVGFRAFVLREALAAGVRGWVRNRRDGSLEAVLSGDAASVERLVDRCRQGPPGAIVAAIAVEPAAEPAGDGFAVLRAA